MKHIIIVTGLIAILCTTQLSYASHIPEDEQCTITFSRKNNELVLVGSFKYTQEIVNSALNKKRAVVTHITCKYHPGKGWLVPHAIKEKLFPEPKCFSCPDITIVADTHAHFEELRKTILRKAGHREERDVNKLFLNLKSQKPI